MKLKQIPEDFIVKERIKLEFSDGGCSYFKLVKKNWTTFDAISEIARRLGINLSMIGVAGNKDKKAVTEQAISIYGVSRGRIEGLNIKDISIEYLGNGNKAIHLGDLDGNDFVVTVRDLKKKVTIKTKKIKNFYDEQRFGINKNNHLVGRAIVKKDFKKACELLGLKVEGNNYVNALRNINRKMLRFYVHAYQSYLFNEALKRLSENKLPVPGFLTKFKNKSIERVYSRLLKRESVTLRDFIVPSFKEIGSEGSERNTFVNLKRFKIKWDRDELNGDRMKAIVSFSLGKGEYGTAVVKELFGKLYKPI